MFKEKACRDCGTIYAPKAPAQIVCSTCKVKRDEAMKIRKREYAYKKFCEKQISLGRGHVIGVGQGGNNPRGKDHPQYKNGHKVFSRASRRLKDTLEECQWCGKDLTNATRWEWCVHHIDRDRSNNDDSNLVLLCKRCHQIEHNCFRAFEGVTTIPKGSTLQADGSGSAEPHNK